MRYRENWGLRGEVAKMRRKGMKLDCTMVPCKYCQELYDLVKVAYSVRKGKIRCPHCNKVIGEV